MKNSSVFVLASQGLSCSKATPSFPQSGGGSLHVDNLYTVLSPIGGESIHGCEWSSKCASVAPHLETQVLIPILLECAGGCGCARPMAHILIREDWVKQHRDGRDGERNARLPPPAA